MIIVDTIKNKETMRTSHIRIHFGDQTMVLADISSESNPCLLLRPDGEDNQIIIEPQSHDSLIVRFKK